MACSTAATLGKREPMVFRRDMTRGGEREKERKKAGAAEQQRQRNGWQTAREGEQRYQTMRTAGGARTAHAATLPRSLCALLSPPRTDRCARRKNPGGNPR